MEKRTKLPWFMDPKTHRFKLGITLPYGLFAGGLMLWGFGVSPLTIFFAAVTFVTCVGQFYLVGYLARKYFND